MIEKMIIVTEIEDEERYSLIWNTLANQGPDLFTAHCCEIDTSTWEEDAWRDWEQRVLMMEDVLDIDEDTVIIWQIDGGSAERRELGIRA